MFAFRVIFLFLHPSVRMMIFTMSRFFWSPNLWVSSACLNGFHIMILLIPQSFSSFFLQAWWSPHPIPHDAQIFEHLPLVSVLSPFNGNGDIEKCLSVSCLSHWSSYPIPLESPISWCLPQKSAFSACHHVPIFLMHQSLDVLILTLKNSQYWSISRSMADQGLWYLYPDSWTP